MYEGSLRRESNPSVTVTWYGSSVLVQTPFTYAPKPSKIHGTGEAAALPPSYWHVVADFLGHCGTLEARLARLLKLVCFVESRSSMSERAF